MIRLKETFKLDDSFKQEYTGKSPNWSDFSYIVYKRTYARTIEDEDRNEEFYETLFRVVEGAYSTQKSHCSMYSLPWDKHKAQKSAQTMFIKMWNFKFLPSGRMLWMMGTDYIRRHGSMALNNCCFISTDDIKEFRGEVFSFVMDALMLGVGVGFDTKGAGKIKIKTPVMGDKPFVVPDSREGWVEGFKKLMDAYLKPYARLPTYFDYSEIRPKGLPIKGFGGISSGPDPYIDLMVSTKEILTEKIGK